MSQNARLAYFALLLIPLIGLLLYRGILTVPNGKPNLRIVHSVGYCNAPLFVAAAKAQQDERSAKIETAYIANPAEHCAALQSPNGPIAAVTPFTNALTAYGNGLNIRIIAGCGQNGLALVGTSAYDKPESLKGRRIGTVSGDTLEQLAYDFVKKNGLADSVTFIPFTDANKLQQALKDGDVAAITHVEPFVTQLINENNMKLITRGEEFWGHSHPDCVLVTTESAIRSRSGELEELVRLFLQAEKAIEKQPKEMVELIAEPMYRMKPENLLVAIKSQSPKIDIRDSESFMIKRYESIRELGYIPGSAPSVTSAFDFSILNKVIKK